MSMPFAYFAIYQCNNCRIIVFYERALRTADQKCPTFNMNLLYSYCKLIEHFVNIFVLR